MTTAARQFHPAQPFYNLPRLPPRSDIETRDVLRACIAARAAVAALNEATHLVPNPSMLINTLPVLEARASSEIENIVTTADRLFQYPEDESQPADAADTATREALRYGTALKRGVESLARRPVTTTTAIEICRTLLGIDIDVRKVPGTALLNLATGATVYTPPAGEPLLATCSLTGSDNGRGGRSARFEISCRGRRPT